MHWQLLMDGYSHWSYDEQSNKIVSKLNDLNDS